MTRKISIQGISKDKLQLTLDNAEGPLIVTTSEGITASRLFDFFDFKKGETYELADQKADEMDTRTFDPFCKLVEDIVEELNTVSRGQS